MIGSKLVPSVSDFGIQGVILGWMNHFPTDAGKSMWRNGRYIQFLLSSISLT